MKIFFIFTCVLIFQKNILATEKNLKNKSQISDKAIVIELGEDFKLKKVSDKIWIENLKIVKAENYGGGVVLKPQSVGSCKIKIDGLTKIVSILPVGYKSAYELWHKLSFQFANVYVGFCDTTVCLKGSINNLVEFEKIIKIMNEKNAPLFLGLQIKDELKIKIKDWYAKYFRENSLTPLKIVFAKTWKVFLTVKEDHELNKDLLRRAGLNVIENKQKLDISDNVRVKILITEVKKELTRSIGIQWPDAYNAQIVNSTIGEINPFDTQLKLFEKNGDMKILASPNLICRNGKSAEFFAGGEFPVVTRDTKNQQTVLWKKYGIELKIKPQIDSVGQMSIELETKISSIDKSREINGIPAIHDHKVISHFDLIQSKTIALSGLIKNETGLARQGLPFLGQIPIIGKLFSSEEFLENRTELIIFVTPELMEP